MANEQDVHHVTVEFLNSRTVKKTPGHHLRLKIGCVLMLLINLDPDGGACNGTRMILDAVHGRKSLECTLINGPRAGSKIFLPRTPFLMDEDTWPWPWYRRQFPVRVAFAMSINKSQGQTLDKCGVMLKTPVFAHGQLYVAASRVGHPDNLQVFLPPGSVSENTDTDAFCTSNVVYTEIFDDD